MHANHTQLLAARLWVQRWAGSYTFISCSYWGKQYYNTMNKILGVTFAHTLFMHRRGTAELFVLNTEYQRLGKTLATICKKNPARAKRYCRLLKQSTDLILPMMKSLGRGVPTLLAYKKFLPIFEHHIAYHVFVKDTTDFLAPKELEILLPAMQDARLYSESVYSQTEVFFRSIMKHLAPRVGIRTEYLTCLTQAEFETYLASKKLPDAQNLRDRYDQSAIYYNRGRMQVITGTGVRGLTTAMTASAQTAASELHGTSAYPGIVRARCRIIPDPHQKKTFHHGDILVTGMTRPEFMPYIKKAGGIITDSGGILSHAAIIARELKIPCVVGAPMATKILRDGAILTLDANTGHIQG